MLHHFRLPAINPLFSSTSLKEYLIPSTLSCPACRKTLSPYTVSSFFGSLYLPQDHFRSYHYAGLEEKLRLSNPTKAQIGRKSFHRSRLKMMTDVSGIFIPVAEHIPSISVHFILIFPCAFLLISYTGEDCHNSCESLSLRFLSL